MPVSYTHLDVYKRQVRLKAEALQKIALQETSANGRHYYLACAKELLG